jgi:DNA polymerase
MGPRAFIDFETRSFADLKSAGVHVYAADPTTEIICMGFAFDDEPVKIATWGRLPQRLRDHLASGGMFIAHNAAFELALWNDVGVNRYGWPKLEIDQIDCTMARCYAMALPAALAFAAGAMGLEAKKDLAGNRLMRKLCAPHKGVYVGTDEEFKRLHQYCAQDVEVERELDKRVLKLSPHEKTIWNLDQRINNRGIWVDVASARKALRIVEDESERLDREISAASDGTVASCQTHIQISRFCRRNGVKCDGVGKSEVVRMLAETIPANVRRVLEIRQEAAKSSTRKLQAILDCASADGRMRGTFQYHGAGTGRWSGRRFQPHNLPRPSIKQAQVEEVFEILATDPSPRDAIDIFHGPPMSIISDCLRGFIAASPGKKLIAMDYNAIEARVVAWLANETRLLELFRAGADVYKHAAADIFGVGVHEITAEQRQVGKTAILALGYQGGVGAFQVLAKAYRVQMAPALPYLWKKASTDHRNRATSRWTVVKKEVSISKHEWLASELTKLAWRDANPKIVDYWSFVQEIATLAVNKPGQEYSINHPRVSFLMKGSFLFCRLPSGRVLTYPYPRFEIKTMPWGDTRSVLTCMVQNSMTNKWERQSLYGGLLVENLTQAVARDILADAIYNLEACEYPVVLHVHDEVVVEIDDMYPQEQKQHVKEIVLKVPHWAKGLPIEAEGWVGRRYRKA